MKTILQKTMLMATISAICGWSNVADAQWTSSAFNGGSVLPSALTTVGNDVFIGISTKIIKLSNNGTSVTYPSGIPSNMSVNAIIQVGSDLFAGTEVGVYKSIDNGNTWTFSGLDTLNIFSMASTSNGIFASGVKFGGTKGIYRSTDNGSTWAYAGTGKPNSFNNILITTGATLIAASRVSSGAYRSTDNGNNWTSISSLSSTTIYGIAVNGTTIYVGGTGGSGTYTSTDDGVSFALDNNLTPGGCDVFAFIGTNIFGGGSSSGVKLSQNGGAFTQQNTGLSNLNTRALAICGAYIYNGTDGAGVWKRPLSDWGIVGINEMNYSKNINISPNPSTGKFTLQMMNDELRMLNNEVKIINILGEAIQHSIFSIQHSTFIDISNQPSGIYFVQIKDGDPEGLGTGKVYNQKIIKQ